MQSLLMKKKETREDVQRTTDNTDSVEVQCKEELLAFKGVLQIGEKDDPLAWWKTNSTRFPVLSKLARMWLAIPATSAPSERIFSLAGRVLTKERNRLGNVKASKIMFVNSVLVKKQKAYDEHVKMLKKQT